MSGEDGSGVAGEGDSTTEEEVFVRQEEEEDLTEQGVRGNG